MADIRYPNFNTAQGLANPDVAKVRFIEFDVDLTKVAYASGDNLVLGTIPRGTIIFAGAVEILVPGASAGTFTLNVGATATSAGVAGNAAARTIAANAVTAPFITTADTPVQIAAAGVQTGAKGRIRGVLVVTEAVKPNYPQLAARDQTAV